MDSILKSLSVVDLPKICRICLKKDELLNIAESSFNEISLELIVETVLNEKIELDDRKPKSICKECFSVLVDFYKFLVLYKDRKLILDKILSTNKIDLSEDDEEINNSFNFDDSVNIDSSLIKLENDLELSQVNDKLLVKEETAGIEDKHSISNEKARLSRGRKRKVTDDQKLEKCNVCDKEYVKSYLKIHKKWYCSNTNESADCYDECALCKKRLLRTQLVRHFLNEHDGEKVQVKNPKTSNRERYSKCAACGLQILRQNMPRHRKLVHGCTEDETILSKDILETNYKKKRFNCDLCPNKNFVNLKRLQRHVEQVHKSSSIETPLEKKDDNENDEENTVCDICGLQILRRNLARHNKTQHKDVDSKAFRELCQVCGMLFNNRQNLKKHHETVHEGKVYRCEQCPKKSYVSRKGLDYHIKSIHEKCRPAQSNAGLIVCEICGRRTPKNNTRRLVLHEMFHRYGHKFMCKMLDCQLTFADSPSRLKHMTNDHENFTCNECHKDFMDPKRFQAHCEIHIWDNNNTDLNYRESICRICNQICSNNEVLAKHLLDVHRIYWCLKTDNCFKMFVTKPSYALHCTDHKKAVEWKRYTCDICKRKFVSESVFLTHQKGHNKTEGKKCPICGYSFVKANKLKIHMRTHTGEKPFQCSYCTKRFISSKRQRLHERYHTGEKPYQCQHCEKGFCSQTEFRRHVYLMHKKEKEMDNDAVNPTEKQINENEQKQ